MIRTTVVGNYPRIGDRPEQQKLRQALARRDREEIGEEGVRQVEDEVTREVIGEQCRSGVDLVTDGQVRWQDPQTYIAGRLGGIRITGLIRFLDTNTYFRQPEIEGPVRWLGPITVRDYRFAVEHSDRPVKAVLTGPFTLAMLSRDRHYRDPERLTLDFARALAEETAALEAAGAEWIQIDEPAILWWPDRFDVLERGIVLLAEARRKARLALYTYFRGPGRILGRLGELPVDLLGVDLAEGRGDLAALEQSPPRKRLALGILDGRNTKLEDEGETADLVRRLWRASGSGELFVNPSSGLEFLPR
ncbi:MAG: methylcobamide--CoM methyltransferase, partial [Acidobacteria bacterium]|nr:methylcobamide--CoM methyltransferase [Acidobacteriota bacterium]